MLCPLLHIKGCKTHEPLPSRTLASSALTLNRRSDKHLASVSVAPHSMEAHHEADLSDTSTKSRRVVRPFAEHVRADARKGAADAVSPSPRLLGDLGPLRECPRRLPGRREGHRLRHTHYGDGHG